VILTIALETTAAARREQDAAREVLAAWVAERTYPAAPEDLGASRLPAAKGPDRYRIDIGDEDPVTVLHELRARLYPFDVRLEVRFEEA